MAFIVGLAMTGFLAVGIYKLFVDADFRTRLFAELKAKPLLGLAVWTWVALIMCCFWGVLFPAFGTIRLHWLWNLQIWQAAGIGSLAGFVLIGVFERKL